MAVNSTYRPREQRRAATILAGLVLGALVLWVIAMATTGSPSVQPEIVSGAELEVAPPPTDDGAGGAGDATGTDDPGQPDGATDTDGPEQGDGTEGSEAVAEGDDGDDGTSEPGEDEASEGQANGTSEPGEDEASEPGEDETSDQAAEDEATDEGETAQPIDLEGRQAVWVTIVASLAGQEFSEAAARSRLDPGQQLLWSSGYPSLNPGLWVIVEGPFDSEGAARQAARRLGNGAYPRALTEDAGDRYCALARGCSGSSAP